MFLVREWKAPPWATFRCDMGRWAEAPGSGSPFATGWRAGRHRALWCACWRQACRAGLWAPTKSLLAFSFGHSIFLFCFVLFLSIVVGSSGNTTLHVYSGYIWEIKTEIWRIPQVLRYPASLPSSPTTSVLLLCLLNYFLDFIVFTVKGLGEVNLYHPVLERTDCV